MTRSTAHRPSLLLLDLDGVLCHDAPDGATAEVLELLRTARRHCRVALLTDTTPHADGDRQLPNLDGAVDVVLSARRVGAARPDPEFFRRALRILQHSPARTLLCDDDPRSTAAAGAQGIDAVHVPDVPTLRAALAERGLLDDAPAAGTHRQEPPGEVLLVLPDRDEAERLAEELTADGWTPCTVHRDMLAGEDDAEDVDWVVVLEQAPDGLPATAWLDELDRIAEQHDGFTSRP
ncbi:MAG TPA: HAD family hydrolase [Pseudonocardiaceae bacterium]